MRILGIDPGLRVTGWGIIEKNGKELRPIGGGEIKTKKSMPESERLDLIYENLKRVIEEAKPDHCVIEKYVPYKSKDKKFNPWTSMLVNKAIGVIELALRRKGIQYMEVRAVEVKEKLVGKKHTSKEQLRQVVTMILGVEIGSYHISDALATAIYYADRIGFEGKCGEGGG